MDVNQVGGKITIFCSVRHIGGMLAVMQKDDQKLIADYSDGDDEALAELIYVVEI